MSPTARRSDTTKRAPNLAGREIWEWRNAVCADKSLLPAARLVAMRLSFHADRATGECFPSQGTLATEVAMHRSRVQRHIADVMARGWLEFARPPKRGVGNRYRLRTATPEVVPLGRQVQRQDTRQVDLLRRRDLTYCVDRGGLRSRSLVVHDPKGNGLQAGFPDSADAPSVQPADAPATHWEPIRIHMDARSARPVA